MDLSIPGRPVGGRRAPSRTPALRLGDFLTDELPDEPVSAALPEAAMRSIAARLRLPAVPATVDDTTGVRFGMDKNDEWGDCVPTGWDNLRRVVTLLLTGVEVDTPMNQVLAWYRTQNPQFDPAGDPATTGPGSPADGGMDMQAFLSLLAKSGVILGFAAVDPRNDAELRAAMWLFLGIYLGVDLQVAQQRQTDLGLWDYVPRSGDWGGHCVVGGRWSADGRMGVVTWAEVVDTTPAWRRHCLSEAWVVLTREHVARPGFRAGFDLGKFETAYTELTGRAFPDVAPPAPADPDEAFAAVLRPWVAQRHSGGTAHVAGAARSWLAARGL